VILVLGGNGNVGSLLVEQLARAGRPVACGARDAASATRGAPVRRVDLERPGTLAAALEGVEAVVWTPSVTLLPRCLTALERSGARRLVVVSSASVHTRLDSRGAQAKRDAEARLRQSGLEWTVLRPTMIYGNARDRNLTRLLDWFDRVPVFPVFGGRALMQPVYIGDVVAALARILERPDTAGRCFDLGGAAPLTYRELLETAAAALGVRPRFVPLSLGAAAWAVRWSRHLGLRLLREEQVWRLGEDKVVDNGPVREALGIEPLSFAEGIACQVRERRAALEDGLRLSPSGEVRG
jgi:uncharacterized protein YbjT (DUF2867 family)